MDQKRALFAVIIFLIGLLAAWLVIAQGMLSLDFATKEQKPELTDERPRYELLHERTGSAHVYSGSIELPTPCHSLSSSITASGKTASIALEILEPEVGSFCAQVIEQQHFTVAVESDTQPDVRLTINGKERHVAIVEQQ